MGAIEVFSAVAIVAACAAYFFYAIWVLWHGQRDSLQPPPRQRRVYDEDGIYPADGSPYHHGRRHLLRGDE